jgi:predicted transposase YdaD
MPGSRHLRGVSAKEQRLYEEIKRRGKRRYGKRAAEVAARTVLKHHKTAGHAKGH